MLDNSSPLPVKASGGIRNIEDFKTMVDLGVKRIGTSSAYRFYMVNNPIQTIKFLKKIKSYLSKYSDDVHFIELIKGASSTFILKILGLLVGYILAIFITNKFGAFVFGQYVTALLIVEILSIISRLGIDTALVRYISRYVHNGASQLINKLFFKSIAIVTSAAIIFTLSIIVFHPILLIL